MTSTLRWLQSRNLTLNTCLPWQDYTIHEAGRTESRVPEAAASRTEEGGEGGWGKLGVGAGASPAARLVVEGKSGAALLSCAGSPAGAAAAAWRGGEGGRAGASWGRRSGRCGARAGGGGDAGGWSKWRS